MRRGQLDKVMSTVPTLLLLVVLLAFFIGLAFVARGKDSRGIEEASSPSVASLAMHAVPLEGAMVPLVYALKLMVEEKLSRPDFITLLKTIPESGACVYVSWGITQDYNGLLKPFAQGGAPHGAFLVRTEPRFEVIDSATLGDEFAVRYVGSAFPLTVRVARTGQDYDLPFLFYRGVCR